MDTTEHIIKEYIGNYANIAEVDNVHDNMSMADDLRFDSLNTLELAMDLEQEFSITTKNEEIYACKVVKDVIDLVKEKVMEIDTATWLFERRHYAYLVDTIANDPDVSNYDKWKLLDRLKYWLSRDFPNFNGIKWDAAVKEALSE